MSDTAVGAESGHPIPAKDLAPVPVVAAIDFATSAKQGLAQVTLDAMATLLTAVSTAAKQDVAAGHLTDIKARFDSLLDVIALDAHEASHQTLSAGTDTTVTFSGKVARFRVVNWSTDYPLLVKNGAIGTDTDSAAARVPKAASASVPGVMEFPFATNSIHVRIHTDATIREVTVEGFR